LPQSYNVLRIQAVNAVSGESIKGVFFELSREKDQLPEEGLTDPEGCYEFALVNTGTYIITTKKTGFLSASKTINVKPSMLKDSFGLSLTIPLV